MRGSKQLKSQAGGVRRIPAGVLAAGVAVDNATVKHGGGLMLLSTWFLKLLQVY
jgi:hypothetical protein